jgi:hypothetical protein
MFPPSLTEGAFASLPAEPSFSFDAWVIVAGEIQRAEGREVAFACGWNSELQQITTARVIARGSHTCVPGVFADVRPGELFLHSHPNGNVSPSDADVQCVHSEYGRGVGFAVCDSGANRLYVVREPGVPVTLAGKQPRVWRFGRFSLTYFPKP